MSEFEKIYSSMLVHHKAHVGCGELTFEACEAIIDHVRGLEYEIASRDERIAELEAMINQSDFDKYLVSKLKNPQLAEEFARVRIADKALHEIVEKQTNLIARLKEDADFWYNGRPFDYTDDYRHRQLMKEITNENK